MVQAAEILTFLGARGDTQFRLPEGHPAAFLDVLGVNTDQAAQPGELAWISRANVERDPQRLDRFSGSVLILPGLVREEPTSEDRIYVECVDPKAAFSRVVHHFFKGQTETSWPAGKGDRLPPDAHIGSRVQLAAGVVIGSGVRIGNDVIVGPNTCIANSSISDGVVIGANCSIGLPGFGYSRSSTGALERFPHVGRVQIRTGVEIGSNTCIDRGALGDTIIGEGTKIDNLVHIAHNVEIGRNVVVIANGMIGGSARIGDGTWVAPGVSVRDQISIGKDAVLGMAAVVLKDVDDGAIVVGNPARPLAVRDDEKSSGGR